LDNFRKSSCAVGNRTLVHSLLFLSQYLVMITIVSSLFVQPFFLFGQSVASTSSSDKSQKQCSPVSVQNMTTSGSRSRYPASNVLDNNINTRWSNSDIGSWIQLDLGTSKNICSIDIAWHEGNERQNNFTISSSNDGIKLSDILSSNSSGSMSSSEKYNVSDTNARYLRITVNGNTQNSYAGITEISVNEVSLSPKYSIGVAGDWGSARNDNWKKTVQLMVENKVDLALGLGDYSYGRMEEFQPVVDELRKAGIIMKGAKGDHDSSSYAKLFQQASMVLGFDAGPARIIILDSENSPSSNAAVLEMELNVTRQPWKIVVTTTPLYTSPSVHDEDNAQTKALQPILDKYEVDLVMWGDNHNYERIKFPDRPTVFIQSGTGGESHYDFDGQIEESIYQNDKRFGITKLTMDNNTLSGQFISYSGRILDNFNIYR
jgi:F5/8 type C domain/Calcineurin-like phosphoesterase